MDLVDSGVPPVTVTDGAGLYSRRGRVHLGVRDSLRGVMTRRTGRGDRRCSKRLQDRFARIKPTLQGRSYARPQDALVGDQELSTVAVRIGHMALLARPQVTRIEELAHIRRRAI